MNIFQFAYYYRRLVIFGFGLSFFSSFGQTFLVSLFVPGFLDTFGISNAYFGTIYSLATLCSALTLGWIGAFIDRVSLKRYAVMVAAGFFFATLLISVSQWIWMLFIGLFGIRLFGQGLCSHTAHTAMARHFITMRGRALSISNLGFSAGEVLLPITVTALIAAIGWRWGWAAISLFVMLGMPALILFTMREYPGYPSESVGGTKKDTTVTESGSHWRRTKVLEDYRFYLFIPGIMASPFLLTGFFLYQTHLADHKGWDIELLASAFVAFGLSKSAFSLFSGELIDRFKACRVFPFFLIPLLVGLSVLLFSDHPAAGFVYMFLAGVTMGTAFNVSTALYAELYGTANIGAIRSMMTMFIVISTAVSPILFGFLLDFGISFDSIFLGSQIFVLISIILAIFMYREAHNIIS